MSIGNLELGLCCINTVLRARKPSVFANRTCRLKTAQDKGINHIKQLVTQNLRDIILILEWNDAHGITSYRLSSDMFPHAANPRYGKKRKKGPRYSFKFAKPLLRDIGIRAHSLNHRLSMHPGQYNQIASPTESVFENTVLDLSHHARILDLIERGRDWGDKRAIICIHGGGVFGDKERTIRRWIRRFKTLPENVRSRIALENCEKCYSSEDCLRICEELNIPHIFDTHHYTCYNLLHPEEKQATPSQLMPRILATWQRRGLKPYFHISEQGTGKTGHHSDYIENIPQYMLNIEIPVTMDVEAKMKEQAILRLVEKYSDSNIEN